MAKVNVERAELVDLLGGKQFSDFRFGFRILGESLVSLPGFHGGALHCFVGALAIRTGPGERQQNGLAEIEALRQAEIPFHVFGINLQLLDQVAQLAEHG